MATTSNATRLADLKTRLSALNCELLEESGTHAGRYNVLQKDIGKLTLVGQTLEDVREWSELKLTAAEKADAARPASPAADRRLAFRAAIERIASAITEGEQANAELERDRTPIDRRTERQLAAVRKRTDDLLFNGRYEGVDYCDDEPAAQNDGDAEERAEDRRYDVAAALHAVETAMRLVSICADASYRSNTEVAYTLNNEVFAELETAKKALEGAA